jgi:hypothetical protein
MLSHDQDQAHAFLEAYYKHQQENEATLWHSTNSALKLRGL